MCNENLVLKLAVAILGVGLVSDIIFIGWALYHLFQ